MAIASIYVQHEPRSREAMGQYFQTSPCVCDFAMPTMDKIAATLELPAAELTSLLQKISDLPGVISLELVFVNYEDDVNEDGFMQVPPEALQHD